MCFNLFNLFADANGAIVKDPNVPKWRRYLIIVLMILVACLSFAAFITNLVWFMRINPYYRYGQKAIIVWILALVTMVLFGLCTLFFIIYTLCGILRGKGMCCLFFMFNLLTWGGIAVGIIAYFYACQSVKVDLRFQNPVPCSAPLNDSVTAYEEHITNEDQYYKWMKWRNNSEAFCQDIMNPALYIEILHFVFYVLMTSFMTGCCCCRYTGKSEDENEADNINGKTDAPNQKNKNEKESVVEL